MGKRKEIYIYGNREGHRGLPREVLYRKRRVWYRLQSDSIFRSGRCSEAAEHSRLDRNPGRKSVEFPERDSVSDERSAPKYYKVVWVLFTEGLHVLGLRVR